ncbi:MULTISPECIES: Cd(II)/Pb(II)-responsive transcriptional regulator [Alteromonadaceae]|uniref:Cd(II)/Pb(II)-responsive transcriptional regulator n=1 Tax=Alteromonadaceae TaxID=72275 RepID=UPI001C08EA8A|nr:MULTISPECIES: Cd(II)/Pb(II)-responsive transcriptional regulator [Aliiglaciecola]MBU2876684.1 Cd(II)/Pb(II)-responsive transcriptional regulator [Aliiglaciecola lipolytica]MDO6710276.1 Cd(II)/Pb(II)-responsive transcriptional regulator [Aliiglaciecola sp. 2_MG-2023]MDO6751424.1 Cd(II)/Pb(II)-responsive transcriptional regulator [Aliiglaciecola sp. 1_MG-2023]
MKIGMLATKSGCSVQTIRFYEKQGLLKQPLRSASNYRDYDTSALKQLTFIRQCRSLGISINEIQQLIALREEPDRSCESVNQMVNHHINEVSVRIDELTNLKVVLTEIASSCSAGHSIGECGVLKKLDV